MPLQQPSNWGSLGSNFTQVTTYLQNVVRYLQQYLGNIYNAIVPFQLPPTAVTHGQSPYTVLSADTFIVASAGSTAATVINLPAATGSGRTIIVVKIDANAQNVNVVPNGSDTIIKNLGVSLTTQWEPLRLSDAQVGNWIEW